MMISTHLLGGKILHEKLLGIEIFIERVIFHVKISPHLFQTKRKTTFLSDLS